MTRLYFKVLGKDRMPCRGGKGRYPEIGEWTKTVQVIPCKSGYHLCRPRDLLSWIKFDGELYLAEGAGFGTVCNNKVVFERVRLVQKLPLTTKLAQEFAYSCALRALPIYEKEFPDDKRIRKCLAVTRKYLDGKASKEDLRKAADVAADVAVRNAWAAAAEAEKERQWQTGKLMSLLGLKLEGWVE